MTAAIAGFVAGVVSSGVVFAILLRAPQGYTVNDVPNRSET